MSYLQKFFQNFTNFSGRTSRKDYWMTVLFFAIIGTLATILMLVFTALSPAIGMLFIIIYGIALLGMMVGNFAIITRRLHDSGKSGAYFLFILIPIVGSIVVFVLLCLPGDPNVNQFGMPEDMPYMNNQFDTPENF